MNIVAFGASNSKTSINKQLAESAAKLVEGASVEVLDLNDFELPLFSVDQEQVLGKPALAQAFFDKITGADAVVVSFAEHNGSYSAAYKNLFDWCSRINMAVFQQKPCIFLSTSLGPGGGASVLKLAVESSPFFGVDLKGSFSLPSFFDNFDADTATLTDPALNQALKETMAQL